MCSSDLDSRPGGLSCIAIGSFAFQLRFSCGITLVYSFIDFVDILLRCGRTAGKEKKCSCCCGKCFFHGNQCLLYLHCRPGDPNHNSGACPAQSCDLIRRKNRKKPGNPGIFTDYFASASLTASTMVLMEIVQPDFRSSFSALPSSVILMESTPFSRM